MLTHYDKLEKLIKAIEKLIKHCKMFINLQEQIYKIYFDN